MKWVHICGVLKLVKLGRILYDLETGISYTALLEEWDRD